MRFLVLSLMPLADASAFLRVSTTRPTTRVRASLVAQEDDGASRGFGRSDEAGRKAALEERGRQALESMRAASSDRGYDPTLQGLQDSAGEEMPAEVPAEFKSTVTLGAAGFLIAVGIISLVFGGSPFSTEPDEVAPPADATPAFGFVPKP